MANALLSPIDLTPIMRTGGVYEGRIVRKVILVFDGGKLTTALPGNDGDTEIADAIPQAEPMEETVIRVLSELPQGECMPGKTLAGKVELTYGGGRFITLIASLIEQKLIENKRPHGYRLKRLA